MEYKVHKYQTKEDVKAAIDLINQGEGIPISETVSTITYCGYQFYEDFYYIISDDITKIYLNKEEIVNIIEVL